MTETLEGIRVLDWTIWQQGAAAGAMLGDLGAEVIKLEERNTGDPARGMQSVSGLDVTGIQDAYFAIHNRNKKSVALDLRTKKGVDLVHQLTETVDVFIHNFRPGVPERLGLDYESLRSRNPRLIYGSASTFGSRGPESSARGYDLLGLARSGIMMASASPETGEPAEIKGAIADQMGAIGLAYGVLAALIARERHGIGQHVETSLLGSMMWLQTLSLEMQLVTGGSRMSGHRRHPANPLWNHYRCGDGEWIALAMTQSDRFWADFVYLIGRPDLRTDPRFTDQTARRINSTHCVELLDEVFAQQPRQHWLELFASKRDWPVTPVNSIADVVTDPQALANDYVVEFDHPVLGPRQTVGFPVALSETPLRIGRRAPEFGEHTEHVLMESLKLDWAEIAKLRDEMII